jgi:hypothetical protein
VASPNGAVMLGRELRLRLDPLHTRTLQFIAKRNGWSSATELAEALLHDAIERTSRNLTMQMFLANIQAAWCS